MEDNSRRQRKCLFCRTRFAHDTFRLEFSSFGKRLRSLSWEEIKCKVSCMDSGRTELAARGSAGRVRTSRRYNLASAVLAFLMWGGWALWINSHNGTTTQLTSGMTQGAASFIITLVMVRAIVLLFHRMPRNRLGVILPPTITVCCSGSCLALAHYLVGTPRIVNTIAPALTVAFSFCLYTTIKLRRDEKTKAMP